ncbi:hypothetical protein QCA50_016206 [Cerrena zonata]|uniref:SNF2 N-terminal domain-containing protein n=1 Tax=Cerrena zonata TaxID=2478898 RepID=A0AAW0FMX5_9APHY
MSVDEEMNGDWSNDQEAGGFIINDSDYASNKRTRRPRSKKQSYKEESDEEPNDEDFVEMNGSTKRKPKRGPPKKSAKRKKKEDEDDDQDNDFTLDNDGEDEDEDLEVVSINRNTRNGSSADMAISLSDEEDDIPLSEKKAPKKPTRKRATKKKKEPKVKVPYFTRMTNKLYEHHPYLKDVFPYLQSLDKVKVERASQPPGMKLKLLPFQLEGLNWLMKQEEGEFESGVLADEMGMGKTIQVIALLMSDLTKRPNLVVGPTVALMQWKHEIENHTEPGSLKVLLFHGANRSSDVEELKKNITDLKEKQVLSKKRPYFGYC